MLGDETPPHNGEGVNMCVCVVVVVGGGGPVPKFLCLQGDPVATCMCNRDKVDCTRECNIINVYVVLVLTHRI